MLYVYTGDGKGKTTAALGLVIRAYGAGLRPAVVFFDKNSEYCNELAALKELGIQSYLFGINRVYGGEFRLVNIDEDFKESAKALEMAYSLAKAEIDILVLDEFLNAVKVNLLPLAEALNFIDAWPKDRYLVLTGRGLPEEIRERADLISEIAATKHPLAVSGAIAQKGIDY